MGELHYVVEYFRFLAIFSVIEPGLYKVMNGLFHISHKPFTDFVSIPRGRFLSEVDVQFQPFGSLIKPSLHKTIDELFL
jgi:hypothetical protein